MLSRRPAIIATLAALVVMTGAAFAFTPANAASSLDPIAVAQVQLANCQLLAAKSTSSAQRTRAQQCITDQTAILKLLVPSSPVPTGSSPVPTPTMAPPTTPPATTPPPTTVPPTTTPPAQGFPDASTTGLPPGAQLTPHPGHITVTTNGATIDGWDISGGIEVRANNVTVQNSRIRCDGEGECIHVNGSLTGVVIGHNDIGMDSGYGLDPQGINVWGKGAASSVVVTGNHIHNVGDGCRCNGAVTFSDNLVDNLDPDSGHGDGIQAEEGPNVVIRHNTISAGNTSSILINDGTDENNWGIDNNLFTWGAQNNYVIHFRAASCPARTCVFSNNVVWHPFPAGTRFVANAWPVSDAAHWYGNTLSDTGATIPVP